MVLLKHNTICEYATRITQMRASPTLNYAMKKPFLLTHASNFSSERVYKIEYPIIIFTNMYIVQGALYDGDTM